MKPTPLVALTFTLTRDRAETAAPLLFELAPHGWQEEETEQGVVCTLHFEDHPLADEAAGRIEAAFPDCGLTMTHQDQADWSMAWKDFFNPIACGETFEIVPPWLAQSSLGKPVRLVIEPKMAFGTGHHATTALCLAALGEAAETGHVKPGMRFLDLGTGSGILGIGLAKLGLTGLGLDIDPLAVVCARENARANQAEEAMETAVGSVNCLAPHARFNVVVANILSGPLISMAPEIAPLLEDRGVLVLSGILDIQAEDVARAYTALGLPEPVYLAQDEWRALVWSGLKGTA